MLEETNELRTNHAVGTFGDSTINNDLRILPAFRHSRSKTIQLRPHKINAHRAHKEQQVVQKYPSRTRTNRFKDQESGDDSITRLMTISAFTGTMIPMMRKTLKCSPSDHSPLARKVGNPIRGDKASPRFRNRPLRKIMSLAIT